MISHLSRRTFLGGAGASVAAPAVGIASGRAGESWVTAARCILVLYDSATDPGYPHPHHFVIPDRVRDDEAERLEDPKERGWPVLVVSNASVPVFGEAASVVISPAALGILPAGRLADLVRGSAPARIAVAGFGLARGLDAETWRRLGALLAIPGMPRRVAVDLAGWGDGEAGLMAFRAGLGPDAAARLAVRFVGDPNRYG